MMIPKIAMIFFFMGISSNLLEYNMVILYRQPFCEFIPNILLRRIKVQFC